MEEIYDFYRNQAARMKPWELDEARADIVNDRVHSDPYNQNDGAWLRFIANTGTLDDVRGFLFDVWSDELATVIRRRTTAIFSRRSCAVSISRCPSGHARLCRSSEIQ